VLSVLDDLYHFGVEWSEPGFPQPTSPEYATELGWAEADTQDRASELTGAVKLVTSLATADGLVLMDQLLRVRGFGVKIKAGTRLPAVYDGQDFERRGTAARRIDATQFGTRHGSMLRYCHSDPAAISVVVSQDGHIRVITSDRSSLPKHLSLVTSAATLQEGFFKQALRGLGNEVKLECRPTNGNPTTQQHALDSSSNLQLTMPLETGRLSLTHAMIAATIANASIATASRFTFIAE